MTRYEKDDLDIFEVRKDSKCFNIVKNSIAEGIHAFPVIVQFPTSKMMFQVFYAAYRKYRLII